MDVSSMVRGTKAGRSGGSKRGRALFGLVGAAAISAFMIGCPQGSLPDQIVDDSGDDAGDGQGGAGGFEAAPGGHAAGGHDEGGQAAGGEPVLVSLEIEPKSTELTVGATQSFEAIGHYSDGATVDLTESVTWNTSRVVYASTQDGLSILRMDNGSFSNKTAENSGLAHDWVYRTFIDGSTLYVCTEKGLSMSKDGGNTFTTLPGAVNPNLNINNPQKQSPIWSVWADGDTLVVGSNGGVSMSSDGGKSFVYRTKDIHGLGSNVVADVAVFNKTIYAATFGGLSMSTDGGITWNTTTKNLGSAVVFGVAVDGPHVHVGTAQGLSISSDGGSSFTKHVGFIQSEDFAIVSSFAVGESVYAATQAGVSIRPDASATWYTKTLADGLANVSVQDVYVMDTQAPLLERSVYAATYGGGIAISSDGGNTFVSKTTAQGLAHDETNNIIACDNCRTATVSNESLTRGKLTAIGAGETTLTATFDTMTSAANVAVEP